jgi:hypothetical protein
LNPSPKEIELNAKLQQEAQKISKKYAENDKVFCAGRLNKFLKKNTLIYS